MLPFLIHLFSKEFVLYLRCPECSTGCFSLYLTAFQDLFDEMIFKISLLRSGMVMPAFNLITWEAKASGFL